MVSIGADLPFAFNCTRISTVKGKAAIRQLTTRSDQRVILRPGAIHREIEDGGRFERRVFARFASVQKYRALLLPIPSRLLVKLCSERVGVVLIYMSDQTSWVQVRLNDKASSWKGGTIALLSWNKASV